MKLKRNFKYRHYRGSADDPAPPDDDGRQLRRIDSKLLAGAPVACRVQSIVFRGNLQASAPSNPDGHVAMAMGSTADDVFCSAYCTSSRPHCISTLVNTLAAPGPCMFRQHTTF